MFGSLSHSAVQLHTAGAEGHQRRTTPRGAQSLRTWLLALPWREMNLTWQSSPFSVIDSSAVRISGETQILLIGNPNARSPTHANLVQVCESTEIVYAKAWSTFKVTISSVTAVYRRREQSYPFIYLFLCARWKVSNGPTGSPFRAWKNWRTL